MTKNNLEKDLLTELELVDTVLKCIADLNVKIVSDRK